MEARDPLSQAIRIAATAHHGQKDKGGEPYILHPLRVMAGVSNEPERIVAVLHDVIEDSDSYSLEAARQDFGTVVADALDAITKRKGESYSGYLARVGVNVVATVVKLADLEDNSNLKRLGRPPTTEDLARCDKYEKARRQLVGMLVNRE